MNKTPIQIAPIDNGWIVNWNEITKIQAQRGEGPKPIMHYCKDMTEVLAYVKEISGE